MIVGLGALEVVQRRLGLAPVVEHVGEVDPRLGVVRVELERPPDPEERAGIVAEPVRGVAEAGRRLGRVAVRGDGELEVAVGLRQQPLAEAGAAELQHELEIVAEPERHDPFVGARARPPGRRA